MGFVSRRYGTQRGLIRHLLAVARLKGGGYSEFGLIDWSRIERLVFVGVGNVCRSAYAEARTARETWRVASVGLAAETEEPADPAAIRAARRHGIDLTHHLATATEDFEPRPSDLYLVMEDRHLAPLREWLDAGPAKGAQIGLLGLWATPKRPMIYDPMYLRDAYFETCFKIIDSAVSRLVDSYAVTRPDAFRAPAAREPAAG